jgi:hypothetical protein
MKMMTLDQSAKILSSELYIENTFNFVQKALFFY